MMSIHTMQQHNAQQERKTYEQKRVHTMQQHNAQQVLSSEVMSIRTFKER